MKQSDGLPRGKRVKSAALACWELEGEHAKQKSRLEMELLQRLHDRTPLWEQYLGGTLEVHVHADVLGSALCVQLAADKVLDKGEHTGNVEVYAYRQNLPVLGGVIDVPKGARPLASFVRLKLANNCHVFLA